MVQGHQVLADHETHSNAFTVHFGGAEELAKLSEQLVHLLPFYSLAGVDYRNFEHRIYIINGHNHSNLALSRKLEGVLDQIDKYLFQSCKVADDFCWHGLLYQVAVFEIILGGLVD